jgi:hypothetical protein
MDRLTRKITLVVPSKGWVCNGQCFGFYITSVSISPFGASVNLAVWSLVHSLGFVYQFSSDFYSMTAGGLLDMYLISCLSCCMWFYLYLIYSFLIYLLCTHATLSSYYSKLVPMYILCLSMAINAHGQ